MRHQHRTASSSEVQGFKAIVSVADSTFQSSCQGQVEATEATHIGQPLCILPAPCPHVQSSSLLWLACGLKQPGCALQATCAHFSHQDFWGCSQCGSGGPHQDRGQP